jgi:hypothetical protein
MVSKSFKCPSCLKIFKKLVNFHEIHSKCPNCNNVLCKEQNTDEFEKKIFDEKQKTSSIENDINNHKSQNVKETNSYSNMDENFLLFDASDISSNARFVVVGRNEENNINRSLNDERDEIINFGLSFISNYINPRDISSINVVRIPFEEESNPPASQEIINKLKHFKMEKEFYKKNIEEDKFEFPKCTICLMELSEGTDVILLPCEHIFHEKCITKWLKVHNTCPLCRYELLNIKEKKEK